MPRLKILIIYIYIYVKYLRTSQVFIFIFNKFINYLYPSGLTCEDKTLNFSIFIIRHYNF